MTTSNYKKVAALVQDRMGRAPQQLSLLESLDRFEGGPHEVHAAMKASTRLWQRTGLEAIVEWPPTVVRFDRPARLDRAAFSLISRSPPTEVRPLGGHLAAPITQPPH